MNVLRVNQVAGVACPVVVCQRTGPAFRWLEAGQWHECDTLPVEIERALPGPELGRCVAHGWRRMGDRPRGSVTQLQPFGYQRGPVNGPLSLRDSHTEEPV